MMLYWMRQHSVGTPVLEQNLTADCILVCGRAGVGKLTLINQVSVVKNNVSE